jgi:hypothetical protein
MTFKLQRNDLSETFPTRFIASQDIPVHDTPESLFEILDSRFLNEPEWLRGGRNCFFRV